MDTETKIIDRLNSWFNRLKFSMRLKHVKYQESKQYQIRLYTDNDNYVPISDTLEAAILQLKDGRDGLLFQICYDANVICKFNNAFNREISMSMPNDTYCLAILYTHISDLCGCTSLDEFLVKMDLMGI